MPYQLPPLKVLFGLETSSSASEFSLKPLTYEDPHPSCWEFCEYGYFFISKVSKLLALRGDYIANIYFNLQPY